MWRGLKKESIRTQKRVQYFIIFFLCCSMMKTPKKV